MPPIDADRNLLFGINALQNDFITRDALIAAMNAWALEKHRSLGDILVERQALKSEARAVLDQLLNLHIARHQGDASATLASMSSVGSIADDLRREVADPDVLASLAPVASFYPHATQVPSNTLDPHATQVPSNTLDPHATQAPSNTLDPHATPLPQPALGVLRYRKVRDHASGNLGVVSIARDEELNREVALKEIKPRNADDLLSQAKFLLEAEVTGGLEHPGIVPVYGLGHYDDGRPYYAMRFIRGKSLHDAIKAFHATHAIDSDPGQRLLELQKLIRRFTDVCNAVAYAHSRGVLHRDLKPDNVMVGKYGETLVVDWGLAKALGTSGDSGTTMPDLDDPLPESSLQPTQSDYSDATHAGALVGTPAYMSPEQAAGRLDLLGPASDIYGLGATLYHLIVGHPPLTAPTLGELLAKIQTGEIPSLRALASWVDPALEAICLKALALRPSDRYASPRGLAEDLDRWIAGEPVLAYPEPWPRRLKRWSRKHQTALATAGSASIVAALLLGTLAWQQAARRQQIDANGLASFDQATRLAADARSHDDPARWTTALAEARRAVDQLESGNGSPAFLQQARTLFGSIQADRTILLALDEARMRGANVKDGKYDLDARWTGYLAAFQACGIDVVSLPVEEAGRRIKAGPIADALITALDDWSRYGLPNVPGTRLRAIARAAETDPERGSIRDAIARKDATYLQKLCERPEDRVALGPRLRFVFDALIRLDPSGRFPLFETIRREHPSDFWYNHELGMAYFEEARSPRLADAVRCLSIAIALRPESPGAHLNLGNALEAQGKLDDAIASWREAIRLKPDYAEAHSNLGVALKAQGKLDEAVASQREAIRLKPDYVGAHSNLGNALQSQGKFDEAVASQREAIRLKPDNVEAHVNLGNALENQGKLDEAVASQREAIRLKPDNAEAHTNLGNALKAQGKFDEAVASYRESIRLKPDFAIPHYNLGNALKAQGKLDEAIASYRESIRLKPDLAVTHFNLGNTLKAQGKFDEAVASYRKAIRFKPDHATAHFNLGVVLLAQGKLDEAVAPYRESIRLKPDNATAHFGLGIILQSQGKLDESAASYREAIRLKPNDAEAYCSLGLLLGEMGRFREALESLERGHALGTRQPNWRLPSEGWVRQHRRFVELDDKLPAILKGEATSADAAERLELAALCSKKSLHAAAVRFAEGAFTDTPAMADDLSKEPRYNAACWASLAGTGAGKDDPLPDEAGRATLRAKALAWLRADLAAWGKVLDGGTEPGRKQAVLKKMIHWKQDADLAGVREEASLAKLPEAEREAWRGFWGEVEGLRKKAGD